MIGGNESGQRADRFVQRVLDRASWQEIQTLFRKKTFKRNGIRSVKPSEFLEEGDVFEIYLSEQRFTALSSPVSDNPASERMGGDLLTVSVDGATYAFRDLIVYEDEEVLVLNKPGGMLTHSDGRDSKQDLTSLVSHYLSDCVTSFFRPATASRLDRGTSGLVMFAKNYRVLKDMNDAMRKREIVRKYRCIVEGTDLADYGELEGRLSKDCKENKAKFVRNADGDAAAGDGYYARLGYRVLRRSNAGFSLLEAELDTGRSHQIRASFAAVGHPVVGDVKYGGKPFPSKTGLRNAEKGGGASFRKRCLLHCFRLEWRGRCFEAESPDVTYFLKTYFDPEHERNG